MTVHGMKSTCEYAAERDQLETQEYAHRNRCPCDASTCAAALRLANFEVGFMTRGAHGIKQHAGIWPETTVWKC